MLDHIILGVSDVERSLAFYEAALKPLVSNSSSFYKDEGGHPKSVGIWRWQKGVLLDQAREARSDGDSLGVRRRKREEGR